MNFDQFKVTGQSVQLREFDTDYDGGLDDKALRKLREEKWAELQELQERLFAEGKNSLLVVLQAMDAAGKDSTIEKLTHHLNAQGCHVQSFKKPSKLELAHDFLWRVHAAAPKAGSMAIFNRSHYEDVLIVKVHGWASPEKIERRYQHINNFEELLHDRGTRVVKFMLNISKDYQASRFKNRLENPEKYWKFNPGDLDERQHWDHYMHAFELAMEKCSSSDSPWYVVPAENRRFRDVMISSVLIDVLKNMNPSYPEPDFDPEIYNAKSIEEML